MRGIFWPRGPGPDKCKGICLEMSAPDRRAMVDRDKDDLSVRRQCKLLDLPRSGVYRPKSATPADDLALMRPAESKCFQRD